MSSLLTDTITDNETRSAASPKAAHPSAAPPPEPAAPPAGRARRQWNSSAAGWSMSLLIHLTAYTVAAVAFTWLGLGLLPVEPPQPDTSIQASLADETVLDDLPALQIVPTAGPDTEQSTQTLQQLAEQIQIDERGQLDTVIADAKLAAAGTAEAESGDAGESPFFRIPEAGLAVTKGSFTAWTDPPKPLPEQFYQIIIEMRLPDQLSRYRISDLSGEVTGTDGYHQRLPYDARKPGAARITGGAEYETVRRNMTVKMTDRKLQLAIRVPGARRLVMDRIRIKSRRLREEQELKLVFGQTDQLPGLNQSKDEQPDL